MLSAMLVISLAYAECTYFNEHGDHDWIYAETKATCETGGESYRDCSVCGVHETIGTVKATGHNWTEGIKTGDCTNPGETYRDCSICGKHEVTGTTDAVGHEWVAYTKEADCMNPGESYRKCSICGAHETLKTIDALDHNWTDREVISEATCEEDGEMQMICSRCGEKKIFTIVATGHDYGDWEITKDATCSSEGERVGTCYKCGKTIKEDISRTEHDYGEWEIAVPATDSSMGKRYHQCDECGATAEEWYYPDGTLYRGMHKNDDVVEMQEMLTSIGFLNDKADGIFGKKTEQAVSDFQRTFGLEDTGVAYPETLEAIQEAAADALNSDMNENETENQNSYEADHCICMTAESEGLVTVYCADHAKLVEETNAVYNSADSDAEDYKAIRIKWQNELADIYDVWLTDANEDLKPQIEAAQTEFLEYLIAMENLLYNCYDNDPIQAENYIIELLKVQCSAICELSYK